MTQPLFASLEARLSTGTMQVFENIRLIDGARVFGGVMERDAEFVGEGGMTSERRTLLRVTKANAVGFASGVLLKADPGTYTVDELLRMERTSWQLDRLASDDGHQAAWWLKK